MIAAADGQLHAPAAGEPLLLRQQESVGAGGVAAELPRLHLHMAVGEDEAYLLRLQFPDGHELCGHGGALRLAYGRQDE